MKLLIGTHDDDIELFAAFTAIREQPTVMICLDSYIQPARGFHDCSFLRRRSESRMGLECLLGSAYPLIECGISDSYPDSTITRELRVTFQEIDDKYNPDHVWAPAVEEGGHHHHNLVGKLAAETWPGRVTHYLSYTDRGKSTDGIPVKIEDGEWIARKLRAMSRHVSQMNMDPRMGCWPHFTRGIEEYYQR